MNISDHQVHLHGNGGCPRDSVALLCFAVLCCTPPKRQALSLKDAWALYMGSLTTWPAAGSLVPIAENRNPA